MYHALYSVNSTDTECLGCAPAKAKEQKSIIKAKFKTAQRSLNAGEIEEFRRRMCDTNYCKFTKLPKSSPIQEALLEIPNIKQILHSAEYAVASRKKNFLINKCAMNEANIKRIAEITKGQSANPNWHLARKHRLTASKFGLILSACERNSFPPSLFKNLMESYNLQGIASVRWGQENEQEAIEDFAGVMDRNVQETGFWLDSSGFLGASPDGLVGDDALIEVKCPYKYRDAANLHDVMKHKKYLFYYDADGQIIINKKHNYYHQAQGQLFLTGRSICYFVIWIPKCTQVLTVLKDPAWKENLNILKTFFTEIFIPHILK